MVRYYHPAESVWGSDITEPPSVSPREVEVEKPTPKSGHARRVSFSLSGHEAALRDLDRSHWQLQPTRHDPRPTSNFTVSLAHVHVGGVARES
jgi:hypothetical protein